jgi:hypothetical protein
VAVRRTATDDVGRAAALTVVAGTRDGIKTTRIRFSLRGDRLGKGLTVDGV